ncbi:MAG: acyl-CoA dehydrogenase family protein, partial [Myxococcota bacterium]
LILTEEQALLRETVRAFLEKEMAPLDREYGDREITPELARQFVKKLMPFGYLGVEKAQDPLIQAILLEELSRVFPSLLGIQYLCGTVAATVDARAHEIRARLAGPLHAGDRIGCAGFSEPNVGSDPRSVECKAVRKGDRYVVSGTKTWISNGHIADVAVVFLRLVEEDGLERLGELLIDRHETPFESRDIETIGLKAWPLSELFFDGIEVPAVHRLGPARPGLGLSMCQDRRRKAPDFRDARCMCALAACGIAQRALEIALSYTQERRQFGKEIGRFQLVQALLADMAMDLEAARLLSYRAKQLMATPGSDAAVSMAKAYATEMGVRVTSKAMECMGAMGLTREAYIERLYRDARMWIVPDGTAQIQRLVIGRELTGYSAIRG